MKKFIFKSFRIIVFLFVIFITISFLYVKFSPKVIINTANNMTLYDSNNNPTYDDDSIEYRKERNYKNTYISDNSNCKYYYNIYNLLLLF